MNDLISRQALCEYALNQKDKSITPNDIMRFPSAQPETHEERTETHTCDLISRQAVIDALSTPHGILYPIRTIESLPSAQPQRTGRWISQDHNKSNGMVSTAVFYYPKCSECGHSGNYDMNFCPHCGARMEGES